MVVVGVRAASLDSVPQQRYCVFFFVLHVYSTAAFVYGMEETT